MDDAVDSVGRGWKIFVALALLSVAALVGWALFAGPERSADHADRDSGFVGFDQSGDRADERSSREVVAARARRRSRVPDAGRSTGAKERSIEGTIVRQKQPAPDGGDAGDAGGEEQLDVVEWRDPDNQKVLGERAWMATPSEEEAEALEEALDRPQPKRYPIDLQERRLGVEVAKDIVQGCFDRLLERAPQAKGRVSVAFDLVTNGTTARFRNVEIPANVHLEEPDFEACITGELSAASFRTAEQGTMHVEYPFLLGTSDHR